MANKLVVDSGHFVGLELTGTLEEHAQPDNCSCGSPFFEPNGNVLNCRECGEQHPCKAECDHVDCWAWRKLHGNKAEPRKEKTGARGISAFTAFTMETAPDPNKSGTMYVYRCSVCNVKCAVIDSTKPAAARAAMGKAAVRRHSKEKHPEGGTP